MAHSNDFKDFSELDFINHPYFQDWVISPDEEKNRFWQQYLATCPEKKETVEKANALLKAIAFKESWPAQETMERSLNGALKVINGEVKTAPVHRRPARVKPLYRTWWAAAAVLVMVMAGWWLIAGREQAKKHSIAVAPKSNVIAPGGNKAILTLADGTRLILDSATNGAITKQGNVTVIKLDDGRLSYKPSTLSPQPSALTYNTITTPRGGQYQLVLADGTKVWLNAASSLRFPTAFAGNERRVELTGEGYFEVAHDASKPFHVTVNDMDVQVLGTHFNINAYEDEESIKTTLLEGSVKVSKGDQTALLKPGQQAMLQTANHKLQTVADVDVEQVVAWKNGRFLFNSANIETVMRQISRWYDVEMVYENKINGTISGNLPRSESISQILKILEATGKVDFKLSGNQIIVKSK